MGFFYVLLMHAEVFDIRVVLVFCKLAGWHAETRFLERYSGPELLYIGHAGDGMSGCASMSSSCGLSVAPLLCLGTAVVQHSLLSVCKRTRLHGCVG